jgi:hypothetical protein
VNTIIEEYEAVGREASRTFVEMLHTLDEGNMFRTNERWKSLIGIIWFTAFTQGYDFRKNSNILDKTSKN